MSIKFNKVESTAHKSSWAKGLQTHAHSERIVQTCLRDLSRNSVWIYTSQVKDCEHKRSNEDWNDGALNARKPYRQQIIHKKDHHYPHLFTVLHSSYLWVAAMSWRNLLQPLCHALQKTWSHPTVLHRSQVAAALATEALQDHVEDLDMSSTKFRKWPTISMVSLWLSIVSSSNSQGLSSPCWTSCCLILGWLFWGPLSLYRLWNPPCRLCGGKCCWKLAFWAFARPDGWMKSP